MSLRALLGTAGIAILAGIGAPTAAPAQNAVAPPSPVCRPRTTPVSQAPATLIKQATVPQSNGRVIDITLASPAMRGPEHVDVLLPPGFDAGGRTRYPVLYLLHGASGAYHDWFDHGVEKIVDEATQSRHLPPFLVVMPDGGTWGFYSDWYGSDLDGHTPYPPPAWATFHLNELVPWIDSHFPTFTDRQHRAIAGLSMGGFGTMSYAARHPDLFVAAGSFSGAVDTDIDYPVGSQGLTLASSAFTGGLPNQCVWGDPLTQDVRWRTTDPTYLAPNLATESLYVATGNGSPGPYDNPSDPAIYGAGAVEQSIASMNQAFVAALDAAGVAHSDEFYGNGTHAWPYWERDLGHFLPRMTAAFGSPPAAPPLVPFTYRSAETSFSVWGWTFTAGRAVTEFTYLSDVRPSGFQVVGSGTLRAVSAPVYLPGAAYIVSQGAAHRTVSAGADGRLAFAVGLGPSHQVQQTSFDRGATDSWVHATVTIRGPLRAGAQAGGAAHRLAW